MVNGIINVYKEKGFTSFDVVAKMRGMFHQKKIGHTGTLDPDAEGVLPVCLGKATRVCELLTDKDKEYVAVLLLGQETDTQDISGQVLHTSEVRVSEKEVRETIASFIGEMEQIPPMYSALKVNGQKLCDLARQGITVERKARKITIFDIEILSVNLPEVTMRVHCSKGTYIRTLCQDIGEKLGTYGCMKALTRTRVSNFTLENAYRLQDLQALIDEGDEAVAKAIASVDSVFMKYPRVDVSVEALKFVLNGNRVPMEWIKENAFLNGETVRLYDWNNKFVGLYTFEEETHDYKPRKLFIE